MDTHARSLRVFFAELVDPPICRTRLQQTGHYRWRMESPSQLAHDMGALARRVRQNPPPTAGCFLVLSQAPHAGRRRTPQLLETLLATMAWSASRHGILAWRRIYPGAGGKPMNQRSEPFVAWPGWRHIQFALLVSLIGVLWFIFVYGGCDAITAHRVARVRIHLDSELSIPFIPETVLIYMSLYLLFLGAPFILRQRDDFLRLALTLNGVILVA